MQSALRATLLVAACALAATAVGYRSDAAAPSVPLTSPAPGSPVFGSFRSAFDNNFTTQFQMTATGADLAYVWSLQNVSCGALASPQGRGPTNGYAHEGCPVAQELPVRVTVLVARASDLNSDGTPRNGDVPRFVYSQVARAQDSTDTQNVPPAPLLQYFGPAAGAATGSALPTTTSGPATSASAATGDPTGFPWWVPLVVIALAGLGLFGFTRRGTSQQKDPCGEQRARVARAKAGVDAARARQQRINELKAGNERAQADLARAQREQANATDDRHVSWGEDVETGQRVYTNKDQKARIDAANAALTAATQAAAAAKSAYEGVGDGREEQQAQYGVEDAERELQRAEEALARCLQTNAPPAAPPAQPTTTAGGTNTGATTAAGDTTMTGGTAVAPTGPVLTTPPPTAATTPKTQARKQCEDGAEPRVDVTERDFELYLVWAGKWQVDGAFQFSSDDVDEALENYKKFKTIVDIAQVAEGLSGAGSTGLASVETALHLLTQGVKQASSAADVPNPIDPSDASQWGVEQALEKLIERVNRLRALGTWTLTCPRVRVHATCRRTFECRGNRWTLTKHEFTLEYGDQIGTDQTSFENVDQTDPARGSREAHRRLTRYFETRNKPAMDEVKTMAQRCAAP